MSKFLDFINQRSSKRTTGRQSSRSSNRSSRFGGFKGDIVPKGHNLGQLQQFDPNQMELYKQQFQTVGPESYLSRLAGGDQSAFEELEAPAMRQFGQLQAGTANRFSGLGSGSQRSSGFQNQLSQDTTNFAERLQGNRLALRQQAIQDLSSMSNQLLGQRPYDRFLAQTPQKQQKSSPSGGIGGLVGAGIGGLAGYLSPFPGGLAAGAQIGQRIGSAF